MLESSSQNNFYAGINKKKAESPSQHACNNFKSPYTCHNHFGKWMMEPEESYVRPSHDLAPPNSQQQQTANRCLCVTWMDPVWLLDAKKEEPSPTSTA